MHLSNYNSEHFGVWCRSMANPYWRNITKKRNITKNTNISKTEILLKTENYTFIKLQS
jgi:hypothetical protein